jgi:hypothetical protein
MIGSRARVALSAVSLLGVLGGLPGLAGCGTGASSGGPSASAQPMASNSAAMDNPNLDLGSSLGDRPAPDFRLRNQFGQPMSLSQFRGKVVMLGFEDSKVASQQSLASIAVQAPSVHLTLPSAEPGGGTVALGPGQPRLVMFFATWLSEVSDLKAELIAASAYVTAARRGGLPPLVAVDETVVEPSAQAVRSYLHGLGTSLRYPVALDTSGRVADGYGVQDQPWFALVSASGTIIWSHDGWLPPSALESAAKRAG